MSTIKAINIQEPSSANVNMLLDSSGNVAFQDGTALAPSITNNGDTNTGIFFPAADTIAFTEGGVETFRIGSSGQLGIGGANYGTSGQVLTSGGASAAPSWATVQGVTATTGSAPYYGARAWVNFDGTSLGEGPNGTYSQSGTTVTATITAHGLSVGQGFRINISTGTAVTGNYIVATVPSANSFTYTAGTSLTTSGNCTLIRLSIRASQNVSSVGDNGTGNYTVFFSTPMADANYAAELSISHDSSVFEFGGISFGSSYLSTGFQILTENDAGGSADASIVTAVVYR